MRLRTANRRRRRAIHETAIIAVAIRSGRFNRAIFSVVEHMAQDLVMLPLQLHPPDVADLEYRRFTNVEIARMFSGSPEP